MHKAFCGKILQIQYIQKWLSYDKTIQYIMRIK